MTSVRIHSPAKLNLFLHITGKRDDGYHDLQSIFQLVDASDEMIFSKNDSDDIKLHIISDKKITNNIADNLIYKSAQLLKKTALQQQTALQQTDKQHKSYGCNITLHKQLPMGGGIGSGSSNAGMTLLVLNRLWGIDFSENQLANLGNQLGADVPIFIRSCFDDVWMNQPNPSHQSMSQKSTSKQEMSKKSKMAWVEGVGELIDMFSVQEAEKILPENSTFCILKPAVHVSTAKLFAHPDLVRNTAKLSKTQTIANIADLKDAHLTDVKKPELINNFESIVCSLYPPVNEALTYLLNYCKKKPENPVITPRLTGTGACVFAVFDNASQATHCLEHAPCAGFLAKPCGSILISQ